MLRIPNPSQAGEPSDRSPLVIWALGKWSSWHLQGSETIRQSKHKLAGPRPGQQLQPSLEPKHRVLWAVLASPGLSKEPEAKATHQRPLCWGSWGAPWDPHLQELREAPESGFFQKMSKPLAWFFPASSSSTSSSSSSPSRGLTYPVFWGFGSVVCFYFCYFM